MGIQHALVMGEMCVDIVVHRPASVPVLGYPLWAGDVEIRLGGSATYSGLALQGLGIDTSFSLPLGDDALARQLTAQLALRGLHTEGICFVRGQPSMKAVTICTEDDHQVLASSPPPLYLDEMVDVSVVGIDLLYFGGYTLYPELWTPATAGCFARARRNGVLVVLDTQILPLPADRYVTRALRADIFSEIDVLLLNRKEASAFTGVEDIEAAALNLAQAGPRLVVAKLGSQGSMTCDQGHIRYQRGFRVSASDLIGAGDYFGAGLSYGLLQGWDLDRAASFANAAAATGISQRDRSGFPSTLADVENLLSQTNDSER